MRIRRGFQGLGLTARTIMNDLMREDITVNTEMVPAGLTGIASALTDHELLGDVVLPVANRRLGEGSLTGKASHAPSGF